MDRGTWRVTVHQVARVKEDLAIKPPPPPGVGGSIPEVLNDEQWLTRRLCSCVCTHIYAHAHICTHALP